MQSQKFSEKINKRMNAYDIGLITNEEVIKELLEIDDNIRALASRLGEEPRKLLSHVLEYRMTCPL